MVTIIVSVVVAIVSFVIGALAVAIHIALRDIIAQAQAWSNESDNWPNEMNEIINISEKYRKDRKICKWN